MAHFDAGFCQRLLGAFATAGEAFGVLEGEAADPRVALVRAWQARRVSMEYRGCLPGLGAGYALPRSDERRYAVERVYGRSANALACGSMSSFHALTCEIVCLRFATMQTLQRGQKIKLETLSTASEIQAGLAATIPGAGLDYSCFGLDEHGKLSDDRYFVFYNQKKSPCGSVALRGAGGGDEERFLINLTKLPASIHRLVFVITVDGTGAMRGMQSGHWRLQDAAGASFAEFPLRGADYGSETALIAGELYRKDGWRVSATGQGFDGGLSALLKHFGGEETAVPPQKPAPAPPVIVPPPAALPALPPRVNLGKVTLDKKGDKQTVDLRKGGGVQPILVNLNWDNPSAGKRGFFASLQGSPDLDLGCMYRMKSGEIGVIQPLGKSFGAREAPPFIFLDKDDRSGAAADGENLTIFRPDLIDLVMVFALVYQGASDFTQVGGRLTVRDPAGGEIFIQLSSPDRKRNFCAICTIRNTGAGVEITKEEQYFPGHKEADQRFGFGFNWVAGSK